VPKIYLDVCCLNRPFDDQTQARIRLEAEAVMMILSRCETEQWEWVSSNVVEFEVGKTPDPERRRRVRLLASHADDTVVAGQAEIERAQQFESWGISAYDALHLACAESSGADVFLTTDDELLRQSANTAEQLRVRVENPMTWLREFN
jgi:predicted nucleic acid-binding protein